jgi:CRISPR/Cas system-associated endonuclease Cas3-HD
MAARAEVKEKVIETQVGEHVKLSPEAKLTYAPRILKPATKKHQISVQERKCRKLMKINVTRF